MKIGIDATNLGNGGGITHLKELLNNFDFRLFSNTVEEIVIFGSQRTLNHVSVNSLIRKRTSKLLNKGIFSRIFYQYFLFDREIKKDCDILLSLTGDYTGSFTPVIGISQNMLLYDREVWKEIKLKEVLRFWLIYHKQKINFKRSDGIIFLSNYAKHVVSNHLDLKNKNIALIHHGISPRFFGKIQENTKYSEANPFRLLYISSVHVYKHQWNVVEAVAMLRNKGYSVVIDLVGEIIYKPAGKRLFDSMEKFDKRNEFVKFHSFVPYETIDKIYKQADGIIFASTCENMPIILVESMASGLPICCSETDPMPEFLDKSSFFFNPTDVNSIEYSIAEMINNPEKCKNYASTNIELAKKYSWVDTSKKTFEFIINVYKQIKNV